MATVKVGNKHKGLRSMHKKGYYKAFRERYELKKINRRLDRDRRIAAARNQA